jgi:hypothetical protein
MSAVLGVYDHDVAPGGLAALLECDDSMKISGFSAEPIDTLCQSQSSMTILIARIRSDWSAETRRSSPTSPLSRPPLSQAPTATAIMTAAVAEST